MLQAIEEVHSNSIIHRDIKLSNFVFNLNSQEKVYLIDFGLADYINTNDSISKPKPLLFNTVDQGYFIGSLNYASLNSHYKVVSNL